MATAATTYNEEEVGKTEKPSGTVCTTVSNHCGWRVEVLEGEKERR